eukprot:g36077.t1
MEGINQDYLNWCTVTWKSVWVSEHKGHSLAGFGTIQTGKQGPVLVITEYCCYGDLLNFLKNKAQYRACNDALNNYKNLMHNKKPLSDCSVGYLPMRSRLSSMSPMISQTDSSTIEEDEDSLPLNIEDLLSFSYQVATGMDFLSSRN